MALDPSNSSNLEQLALKGLKPRFFSALVWRLWWWYIEQMWVCHIGCGSCDVSKMMTLTCIHRSSWWACRYCWEARCSRSWNGRSTCTISTATVSLRPTRCTWSSARSTISSVTSPNRELTRIPSETTSIPFSRLHQYMQHIALWRRHDDGLRA